MAITEVNGLSAYGPDGELVWTVTLDDPACTRADDGLTCVHGEGNEASIATITASGEIVADLSFPRADIGHAVDGEVIVAGAGPAGQRSLAGPVSHAG
ncbi:hypothetical protein [Ruania halotolerans]|uniref:hypothetical protein n=1 Tax=Ruania halotolerans TaxID=2897773 RepID=UPI001E5B6ECC|nr:hypothetical protein [Ruania halotolerans]UFU05864.1 hypothetical protein LQF10_15730 [Ruania halotolerans]